VDITIPPSVLPGDYFIKPIVINSVSKDTIPVHSNSALYPSLTVKGTGGTGLKDISPDMKVNVYEADGLIQILSAASNQIKEIEIYNLQGLLIYKDASINAISYTVNRKLPTGVYIVKVISEKNTDNVKLILH